MNHSCLAIAGASLLTSMSFSFVDVEYQLMLATDWAHLGSSAYTFHSWESVLFAVNQCLDFHVNFAVRSLIIAWYPCEAFGNIVWFWLSTQYQISHILTFQGLLFLSGLFVVVQGVTVNDSGVVVPVPLAGLLSQWWGISSLYCSFFS